MRGLCSYGSGSAFRGSDRFTATVSIRQRHVDFTLGDPIRSGTSYEEPRVLNRDSLAVLDREPVQAILSLTV